MKPPLHCYNSGVFGKFFKLHPVSGLRYSSNIPTTLAFVAWFGLTRPSAAARGHQYLLLLSFFPRCRCVLSHVFCFYRVLCRSIICPYSYTRHYPLGGLSYDPIESVTYELVNAFDSGRTSASMSVASRDRLFTRWSAADAGYTTYISTYGRLPLPPDIFYENVPWRCRPYYGSPPPPSRKERSLYR